MFVKIRKKLLCFALIFILVMPALFMTTGCKKDKTINLTLYSQLANFQGEQQGFFATILKDKFNVKLNIINNDGNRFTTLFSSGRFGDLIIFGSNGADYQDSVTGGRLLAWDDELLTKHAPNIKSNFGTALAANKEINQGIGPEAKFKKTYGIGHGISTDASDHESFFYSWDIRWDLYAKLGYPSVETLDDYIDMLAAMKQLNPTDDKGRPTYAISPFPDWDVNSVMNVKSFASSYYGFEEFHMGHFDADNNVFHGPIEGDYTLGANNSVVGFNINKTHGPYIEALKFFYKLNQKGLVDPAGKTGTWDSMAEKVTSGGTFISTFDFTGSNLFNTTDHIEANKMMLPLMPGDACSIVSGLNPYGGERIWAIDANTEHATLCMEILDWLASPEGAMTTWYGLRGLTWDYDENLNPFFTEFGTLCEMDIKTSYSGKTWISPYTGKQYDLSGDHDKGKFQGNNIIWSLDAINPDTIKVVDGVVVSEGERFHKDYWSNNQREPLNETESDWREKTGANNLQDYMETRSYRIIPAATYAESRKSAIMQANWNSIREVIKTRSWLALSATGNMAFEAAINQMITESYNLGYQEILDWHVNEAVRKWGAPK